MLTWNRVTATIAALTSAALHCISSSHGRWLPTPHCWIARANLRGWQESHGSPSLALAEWEQILSSPVDQVVKFLVERSERATRLRQSSPFTGILTEAERLAVYESHSTRTHHPGGERNLG
jgi:hypothetical protein